MVDDPIFLINVMIWWKRDNTPQTEILIKG